MLSVGQFAYRSLRHQKRAIFPHCFPASRINRATFASVNRLSWRKLEKMPKRSILSFLLRVHCFIDIIAIAKLQVFMHLWTI